MEVGLLPQGRNRGGCQASEQGGQATASSKGRSLKMTQWNYMYALKPHSKAMYSIVEMMKRESKCLQGNLKIITKIPKITNNTIKELIISNELPCIKGKFSRLTFKILVFSCSIIIP